MGELKIVKLDFRSALHLGADVPGIGLEGSLSIAHSDTLFSCLINSYAELHSGDTGAVKKLLKRFCEEDPPFRISSAFPFQIGPRSDVQYYLPKPLIDPPLFYNSTNGQWAKREYGKLVRETQLVPIDTFKNWIEDEDLDGLETQLEDLEEQNIDHLCLHKIRPQHARDRLTDATNIYHTGLIHFHGSSGLYFLAELNDWEEFESVLRHAGRNGLGGRRSHGNGVFNVTKGTISDLDSDWQDLFALPKQNGFISLSLYLPEDFDCLNPVAYQLVPRRGWCYSSVTPTQMKRKTVTMFGEGSVFRNNPKGGLADVTPDDFTAHKLYRYGIPISLPIKILEEEDDIS